MQIARSVWLRSTAPTVPTPCTYEPSLLLIAQGRKRVDLGRTNYVFGQSRFLLTSVELPVVSQVITASEETPCLAFFLKLDISTVRDILNTEEVHVPEMSAGARGMAIGETTVELVNACSRLLDLLDAPQDIPFFGKLIQREIIYRLLQGTQGQRLQAMATLWVRKIRQYLDANASRNISVRELVSLTGLNRMYLTRVFTEEVGMPPHAYLLGRRLQQAQALLLRGEAITEVALATGFTDQAHFSRHFKKYFGLTPSRSLTQNGHASGEPSLTITNDLGK